MSETFLLPAQHWLHLAEVCQNRNSGAAWCLADAAPARSHQQQDNDSHRTAALESAIIQNRSSCGRAFLDQHFLNQYCGAALDGEHQVLNVLRHHAVSLLLDGKLHRAPLDKDIEVAIDIGTGTGTRASHP
ncbi:hypothetical protein FALCPG4_017229 [Fusarium falciforme]